ncbi:MAG: hypothetical protein ABWY06_04595 [Pseudomonas sp.]|uniref:hypothetical protein n=1 Tax=Pseudomonas sp. TaxID=306 RepID=UPI0033922585
MQLPDSLQPWSEWLEWFAPERASALGDLLGRLNTLLGPMRERQSGGQPEPEGLGDLQRRGPYERLLSSEWLLADELPDEFLRRAAGGEHLFLAPQQRARQANRLIVALFDAGPRQLGAPRLVHLAMLILLARRARQAGGELLWGVLQRPAAPQSVESAVQLKWLLNARTFDLVDPDHCRDWALRMDELAQIPDECWVIGQHLPVEMAQPLGCSHSMAVTPGLDGTHLQVETRQRLGSYRLLLPLPTPQAATDLLNGHFKAEGPQPTNQRATERVALTIAPVLSCNGSRIAVPLLDKHGALVIQLPSLSRRNAPPKMHTTQWSGYQQPLAITFAGQVLGAMIGSGDKLFFWQLRGLVTTPRPPREALLAPAGTGRLLPSAWLQEGKSARFYALDSEGRLVCWIPNTPPSQALAVGATHLLDDQVLGFAALPNGRDLIYLRRDNGQLQLRMACPSGKSGTTLALGAAPQGSRVLFGGGSLWNTNFGALAVSQTGASQQIWQLYLAARQPYHEVHVPENWRVIGLYRPQESDQAFFVLLGANRQSVSLFLDGNNELVYTAPAPAAKVSVCPSSGQVVILTETRELIVYSLEQRGARLHLHCTQAAGKEAQNE